MPFPLVFGIPNSVEPATLHALRRQHVTVTVREMECPKSWVHPMFFVDLLNQPTEEDDGSNTIMIKLETGMFHGREDDDSQVAATLKAISEAVWQALEGVYGVESSVNGWHPGWKHLIKARDER